MEAFAIQLALGVFSVLMTIMVGLMTWQALAVIAAGKSIIKLEVILNRINDELCSLSGHEKALGVLDSEVKNLKASYALMDEQIRSYRDDRAHSVCR